MLCAEKDKGGGQARRRQEEAVSAPHLAGWGWGIEVPLVKEGRHPVLTAGVWPERWTAGSTAFQLVCGFNSICELSPSSFQLIAPAAFD